MQIGIDLGGTKIEALALDESGNETHRIRIDTPRHDYQGTVAAITQLVFSIEKRFATKDCRVGIGTPGALSPLTGRIKNSNSTWLIDMPLDVDLSKSLNREVHFANDADCFALSEATDGAGKNFASVFGVILGTGVGGGIVIQKKLLSGPNAIAGEWGHNPLPWASEQERPGPLCYCGLKGCIETFLSGIGLSRDFDKELKSTGKQVAKLAKLGEPLALQAVRRYEDRLARALASVINILDPEAIVLGGGASNIESLYENVPKLWGPYVFSDSVRTQLLPAKFGDSSGVRGAAWLWKGKSQQSSL